MLCALLLNQRKIAKRCCLQGDRAWKGVISLKQTKTVYGAIEVKLHDCATKKEKYVKNSPVLLQTNMVTVGKSWKQRNLATSERKHV